MRPIPISDAYLAAWQAREPRAMRRVLAAPSGDLLDPDIAPLEVVWRPAPVGPEQIVAATSLWVPDTDDAQAELGAGGTLALTIISSLHPPIMLSIIEIDDDDAPH